jgi:Mg-chelatase subunit ChlD
MTNANNFELNKGDNFIFGLDVSGSMAATDTPTGQSRIEYAKEKAIQFANEASKWDEDGIDLITFGHQLTPYLNVTAATASEVIGGLKATEGSTDTAGLIRAAYARHKEIGATENTVLFIVTDGAPNDKEAVKQAIIDITNDIKDEHEFAISFLTVGNIDAALQAFLTGLDDDLTGAKHDIVDVKALDQVDFITAFVGALHD